MARDEEVFGLRSEEISAPVRVARQRKQVTDHIPYTIDE